MCFVGYDGMDVDFIFEVVDEGHYIVDAACRFLSIRRRNTVM